MSVHHDKSIASDALADLEHHMRRAIAFISHTEAFGKMAESGILQAGNDRSTAFNVDEAKKVLAGIEDHKRELAEVRAILSGGDAASLPNDYPMSRMASDRMMELAAAEDRYLSAVRGRADFRKAYRDERAKCAPSAAPRMGLLRGVSSLLHRCLRHGLLRAEAEAMIRDIDAVMNNGERRGEQTRSGCTSEHSPDGHLSGDDAQPIGQAGVAPGLPTNAAPQVGSTRTAHVIKTGHPEKPAAAVPVNPSHALPSDWTPTAANVNALPEPVRRYIHDIETRCDPAGDVAALTLARDQIRQLEASNRQLRDARSATPSRECPYCTSDNPAIRTTYYDQTCEGCVKRMGQS